MKCLINNFIVKVLLKYVFIYYFHFSNTNFILNLIIFLSFIIIEMLLKKVKLNILSNFLLIKKIITYILTNLILT